ncbi:GNAT family N-acetyltransferase [Paenibacillus sp. N3/727]|uniref:GNAT family N-acetyltransferase n=1 Tax=Paenibacillus sp. N3/727 TaxID=2925845 RepID=UPI001F52FA58|nr:N-acetyltransferase [Paenibacillus sp. N3/727]UNK16931.1 GNAT family N-acetyltransferase [Paenibacillus sp. N3/727]
MSELFIVREATIEDLDGIAVLFNHYRTFYKQDSDLEGAKAYLSERFEQRESVIFTIIERSSDQYAAFTQLYPSFSSISMQRSWILNDLYVHEDYRKQGVAQLLLDAAKSYAQETKSKGLSLSTAADNVIAQKLYERNGYVKDEGFFHYDLNV